MLGDPDERIYESNSSSEEEKYRCPRKNTTRWKTPTMSGNKSKWPVQISIDEIRPGLFCVHCHWDKPNESVAGNKNADFPANPFSSLSIKVSQHQQPQPSPLFGRTSVKGGTKTTATGLELKPNFNFTTSTPSTLFSFGAPESKAPPQQQTSNLDEKAEQKKSPETSSVQKPFGSSVQKPFGSSPNSSGQPEAKNETVKYVAEFTINQQAYILKASFTTSACNVVGSLALKQQVRTKSWLAPDKVTGDIDELVEKDDIQLPSAVWVNLSGTEKKYHNLTSSNLDHSWVSDDFDGSFARFTSFNAGPTNWKTLACSVWVQFEASNMREKKALKQIVNLYVKQTYCDVQFSLRDDQHIGAHRYILMARSPVFAAMFQNDMEETTTGQVKIEDCEPDIFKQLLHYIYSGKTSSPLTDAMAQSLFVVSGKYDIQDLKEECVTFLLTCVRMDNVVGLFVWSNLRSVEELKEATLAYMARNGKKICLLKDLEELAKNYPDLSVLAFRSMMGCTVHWESKQLQKACNLHCSPLFLVFGKDHRCAEFLKHRFSYTCLTELQ